MKKLAIIGAEVTAQSYAVNARMMGVETHGFAWAKGAAIWSQSLRRIRL